MKRLTASVLALLLLLLATGCGRQQEQSNLQDRLNQAAQEAQGSQTPAGAPDLQPEPEAEQPEAQPQPEYEPTEGAPDPAAYEVYAGLEGAYRRTDLPEDAGYDEVLRIFAFGDILVLETSAWVDGAMLEFVSMEEFWPDPSAPWDGEDFGVTGTSQPYSSAYDPEGYCGAAETCSIVRTDDGVVVQRPGQEQVCYQADDTLTGDGTAELREKLRSTCDAADAGPVGQWAAADNESARLLRLEADGTFVSLYKQVHRPVQVLVGAWVCDAGSGQLHCLARQVGVSAEEVAFQLDWELQENEGLWIRDLSGQALALPEDGGLCYAWDRAWFTGLTLDYLMGADAYETD